MDINKNTLINSKLLPKFSKIQSKDMYQAISYLTKGVTNEPIYSNNR